MPDKKTLFVVVRINKPASYSIRTITPDFAGIWVKNIYTVNLDLYLIISNLNNIYIGFAKNNEEIPLPVFFRSSAMCRSAFILAFKTGI